MKKLLLFLMLTLSIGIAAHSQDNKDKVKKTSQRARKFITHSANTNTTKGIKQNINIMVLRTSIK